MKRKVERINKNLVVSYDTDYNQIKILNKRLYKKISDESVFFNPLYDFKNTMVVEKEGYTFKLHHFTNTVKYNIKIDLDIMYKLLSDKYKDVSYRESKIDQNNIKSVKLYIDKLYIDKHKTFIFFSSGQVIHSNKTLEGIEQDKKLIQEIFEEYNI